MFNHSQIQVELEYKRRDLLRQAEQRRLIRESKKAASSASKKFPSPNALLVAVRPG